MSQDARVATTAVGTWIIPLYTSYLTVVLNEFPPIPTFRPGVAASQHQLPFPSYWPVDELHAKGLPHSLACGSWPASGGGVSGPGPARGSSLGTASAHVRITPSPGAAGPRLLLISHVYWDTSCPGARDQLRAALQVHSTQIFRTRDREGSWSFQAKLQAFPAPVVPCKDGTPS